MIYIYSHTCYIQIPDEEFRCFYVKGYHVDENGAPLEQSAEFHNETPYDYMCLVFQTINERYIFAEIPGQYGARFERAITECFTNFEYNMNCKNRHIKLDYLLDDDEDARAYLPFRYELVVEDL